MKNKTALLLPLEFLFSNLFYGLVAFAFFGAVCPYYLFMFIGLVTDGFSETAHTGVTLTEAWKTAGPLVLFSGFIIGSATMVLALTDIEERALTTYRNLGVMLTGFTIGNLSIVMMYRYMNVFFESLGGILPPDFLVYGEMFCVVTFLILVVLPMLANLHIFLLYLRTTKCEKSVVSRARHLAACR